METTPDQQPHSPRRHHPIVRLARGVRELGNQVAVIRVKWLLGGMLVFLVAVVMTQVQFNEINEAERLKIAAQQVRDKYGFDLINYNNQVGVFNDCVAAVGRSDLNRGQHEAIVAAFENLKLLFPDSQGLASVIDPIVIDMRAGPLLSTAPRSISECDDPGEPPELPPQLGELLLDPMSAPTVETTVVEPIDTKP